MQKFCHNKMQILVVIVSWKFYNYHGIRAKQSKFLMSNENKPKNLTVYFTTLTKQNLRSYDMIDASMTPFTNFHY